jgi:hypothetical protein
LISDCAASKSKADGRLKTRLTDSLQSKPMGIALLARIQANPPPIEIKKQ